MMKNMKIMLRIFACFLLFTVPVFAGDGGRAFDSEKMKAELEKQLELSREQWEKLKPVLDQKSKELQQSMHESVDKGYMALEEFSKKLDIMSKDAEGKVREVLSREEVQRLRNYLGKIDEDAVKAARDLMVAELTAQLELTGEQAAKIKPLLEESMARLSTLFNELMQEGSGSWDAFSKKFEQLTQDLRDSLQETLDNEQMKRLEEYNKEQKEKIKNAVYTA